MSFVTFAALALAVLVAAPFAAHLLRRRQAEERPFPPARLVPATPPTARRRSLLEDRALLSLRALSVLALAVLGATPFVNCSRLALSRQSGASVALAIVVDDSLSMRAPLAGAPRGGKTRWARALEGAHELASGLRAGDAVAIVRAGAPARVALASTTDMGAVSATLDALEPTDRATDLDGAVLLARGLLRGLAQPDKRVVVLSDLADGNPDATPLGALDDVPLWAPLPELVSDGEDDCAILRADRAAQKVLVRVVCTPPRDASGAVVAADAGTAVKPSPAAKGPSAGRRVELRTAAGVDGTVSGKARVLKSVPLGPSVVVEEVPIDLPEGAPELLTAALTGADAIAADDSAPVLASGGSLSVAIVVDASTAHVATGGAPPIEQAFSALELDAQVHPLPAVPERADDLAGFAAIIVDDAPGFTPEVRRALTTWVEKGGVALFTLGPRAAAAPLGAGFEPLVPGVIRWGDSPVKGADPATAGVLGASADGLAALAPRGRASLDATTLAGADVLTRWKDGAPLLLRRARGRGAVLTLTLPLSADESDLVLRPAFLALVSRFVATARARGGARRVDVGETWTFDGYKNVKVDRVSTASAGSAKSVPVTADEAHGAESSRSDRPAAGTIAAEPTARATPDLAGLYELTLDGEKSLRVVAVPEREIDMRPRKVAPATRSAGFGGVASALDASPYVALALLALLAAELLMRVVLARREG